MCWWRGITADNSPLIEPRFVSSTPPAPGASEPHSPVGTGLQRKTGRGGACGGGAQETRQDLRGGATARGRTERRLPAETGVSKMATTKRVLYVGEQAWELGGVWGM